MSIEKRIARKKFIVRFDGKYCLIGDNGCEAFWISHSKHHYCLLFEEEIEEEEVAEKDDDVRCPECLKAFGRIVNET